MIATDKAFQGKDMTRIMALRNMTEDQLNLELTRIKSLEILSLPAGELLTTDWSTYFLRISQFLGVV